MSLTSHLDRRHGTIREWFEEHLPNLKPLQEAFKAAEPPTLMPLGPPNERGIVGAAFDYRLRYGFVRTPAEDTVAGRFASMLARFEAAPGDPGAGGDRPDPFADVGAALDRFLAANDPRGRVMDGDAERLLGRLCCVLALYEAEYRSGRRAATPLNALPASPTVQDHLALISDTAVDDVLQLYQAFVTRHADLFDKPITPNPSFSLSRLLGGADGDLIVDGCLLEIKATTEQRMRREWGYQVLGYVLADSTNEHGIIRCGFYLARTPALLTWSLDQLVSVGSNGQSTLELPGHGSR